MTIKTRAVGELETELKQVMESEAATKEALDEILNKQKKRRETHLLSDKHHHQLSEEDTMDDLIG